MENRPWTTFWVKKFKEEQKNRQKRFKRLDRGYPPFELDEWIIDIVDMEEFVMIEEHRIPIFVGSQFGIYPRIEEMPEFFNGRKVIAILSKSLLSGHVSGLTIYQIEENEKQFNFKQVERYPNH